MLVVGSRGSPLALWQAEHVRGLLAQHGIESRLEIIRTSGDRLQSAPLSVTGTKDLFTKEIEEALLDRRVDLAVHSLKDLTTVLPDGLCLAATPPRDDPRDAVAGRTLASLPPGAAVGTSSVRRAAQLRRSRPDLRISPVRGNVDTRLRKLDAGEFEALILAAAGLRRLNLANRIVEWLPVETMCPAPGQGALGIETAPSGPGFDAARLLNHPDTWSAITAERAVLEALGGGCQLPAGAIAEVGAGSLVLRAVVITPDGTDFVEEHSSGLAAEAHEIGLRTGDRLLARGGRRILDEVYADSQ